MRRLQPRRPSQHVFTIVDDIRDDAAEAQLREALRGPKFPFDAMPMVHFASFVIFDKKALRRDRAKLVLECVIDGDVEPFLEQLVRHEVKSLFQHCLGPRKHETFIRYLRRCVTWPELYHIATPYRSVASIRRDETLRRQLSGALDPIALRQLNASVDRNAPGMPEWWWWEILEPWVAVGLAALAVVEVWLALSVPWMAHGVAARVGIGAGFVLGIPATLIGGWKLWASSSPVLRESVNETAIAVAVAFAIATIAVQLHAPRWIALPIAVIGGLASWWRVTEVFKRRTNARLSEMRVTEGESSPMADVPSALEKVDMPARDGPVVMRRIVAWAPWFVVAVGMTWAIDRFIDHSLGIVIFAVAVAVVDAIFVSILCGWPAGGNWTRWSAGTAWYVVFSALVALAVTGFFVLSMPATTLLAFVLNVVIVAHFFLQWGVKLATPSVAERQLITRADLEQLLDQEDHGVQNHMSALVPLPDERFRAWTLRAFLTMLNVFFFRSWLPDLYRGKLFGVPTVHFCQWVLLDNINYVFLSNYDHSWNAYLDDFGDNIATGLLKIWGQGIGMPGVTDLGAFKQYVRSVMVPHSQWYSAYPELSTRHIWNNEQIRNRLRQFDGHPEEFIVEALRRLSAAPKSLPGLLHARTR